MVKPEDLNRLNKEYGSEKSIVGLAEKKRYTRYSIPKLYAVLLDKKELRLVQLDLNLQKKDIDAISIKGIEELKVKGSISKTVKIKTAEQTYRLIFRDKTVAKSIKPQQTAIITELEELAHQLLSKKLG